jgi:hypothetical protein
MEAMLTVAVTMNKQTYDLYRALVGNLVTAAPGRSQVYDAEVGRCGHIVTHMVEGCLHWQRQVCGKEAATCADLRVEPVDNADRVHASVQQGLLEAAQQPVRQVQVLRMEVEGLVLLLDVVVVVVSHARLE